jgi:hypothetical protein
LIIEQCVVQLPIFCVFSAVVFVVEFYFNALWSDRRQGIISIFLYLLRLALFPRYDQFWRNIHGLLKRMYILWMLDEIFCRHHLGPFDLWCDLVLEFIVFLSG